MAIEENKDAVRRMIADCVNQSRADLLEQFVHPDLRVHPGTPGTAPDTEGVDGLRAAFERFHTTFPDLHITPEEVIAEGDVVAARWTATGTHSGELAGIAPTGASVRWGGTDVYRFADGKIVEWWRNDDFVGLLHQVGRDLLPAG
jgi:predicted ester cyclase